MVRSAEEVDRIAALALETLEKEIPITAAILFGSYVEGRQHAGSDIDLAVFTPDDSRLKLDEKARLQLHLQRNCALDLELHLYSTRRLERARPTNFFGYLLTRGRRLR